MTDLVTRAQIIMLAETVDVEPERLAGLERLDVARLRALRERISDVLFDEHAQTFARVSKLAPLVPNALVAKLSEALVPPLVAGRAAGALGTAHPGRAAGVLALLSARYMADCAPYLDPRTISALAPVIPVPLLVGAANELMVRRAYVTASRFLNYAGPELIQDFERGIPDDVGLLMTAALTDTPRRLAVIVRLLPRQRVESIVRSAATGEEPLLAGLSLLSRLDDGPRSELGETFFAALDDERLGWVLRTATRHGAVPELLGVASRLSEPTLRLIGGSPALADDGMLEDLVEQALARGRRAELESVVAAMGGPAARRAAELLAEPAA
ncbi:MAG TPA: hypothetical protein VGH99_07835 [Pseudonocardia sp.]|jgi:hypothetical protein